MAEVRTATRIGWIGLGKMGLPICLRLRRVGFPVSVPCRNAAAKQAATTNGFEVAHTIADAATGADIIVSAISDDKALLDIVFRAGGLKDCLAPGQVYVDISTASPDASGRVAEALELVTVKYVRAPVSGSAATAMQGALTALVSGPSESFATLPEFFAAFTRSAFLVGFGAEARYLKLAINAMVGATSALLAKSLMLARMGGMDIETIMNVGERDRLATDPVQAWAR